MRTFIDYTHRSRPSKKQGIQVDEGLLGDTENDRTSFANKKLKQQYQTNMLIGHDWAYMRAPTKRKQTTFSLATAEP